MKSSAPKRRAEPQPRPGVELGDDLYVHRCGQPCTGRVVAHGRHGVTVHIDGRHQQVRWERVLGHKRRAAQRYAIVDEGDDGMIVEDAAGRRRYVGTPNDAKDDPLVAKAQRPILLFTKATGTPPGPGLQKKQLTDKNGVVTSRWVSVDRNGPPAQRGQHVGFENGTHRDHGEVSASGQDGVTVRDRAGGVHRVPHEKVTHHWQGAGAPDRSPHEPQDAPSADEKARRLFEAFGDVDKLSSRANQPHSTWEDLSTHAPAALRELTSALEQVSSAMDLKLGKPAPGEQDDSAGRLLIGGIKSEQRAREKTESDYDGDYSMLCDVVRATVVVQTLDQVVRAIELIRSSGLELAQKPKNRMANPLSTGYRDLLMVVRLPGGMVAELQVNLSAMQSAKKVGHREYETTRALQAKYGEGEPSDSWSSEDHSAYYRAMKLQQSIYGHAWAEATGDARDRGPSAPSKPLIKSDQRRTIILWERR